jgi:hypothetical protein
MMFLFLNNLMLYDMTNYRIISSNYGQRNKLVDAVRLAAGSVGFGNVCGHGCGTSFPVYFTTLGQLDLGFVFSFCPRIEYRQLCAKKRSAKLSFSCYYALSVYISVEMPKNGSWYMKKKNAKRHRSQSALKLHRTSLCTGDL